MLGNNKKTYPQQNKKHCLRQTCVKYLKKSKNSHTQLKMQTMFLLFPIWFKPTKTQKSKKLVFLKSI